MEGVEEAGKKEEKPVYQRVDGVPVLDFILPGGEIIFVTVH
jgi:hypothetical protein